MTLARDRKRGCKSCLHCESIWKQLGSIWKHLEGIWEAFGTPVGSIWSTSGRHLGLEGDKLHTEPQNLRSQHTKDGERLGWATAGDAQEYPYLAGRTPTHESVCGKSDRDEGIVLAVRLSACPSIRPSVRSPVRIGSYGPVDPYICIYIYMIYNIWAKV